MSDFLSHLAARAISAPTLRPRTPFRFEPLSLEEPVVTVDASPQPRERVVERERTITREVPVTTVITEPGETRVVTREVEAKPRVMTQRVVEPTPVPSREEHADARPSSPRREEKVPKADEGRPVEAAARRDTPPHTPLRDAQRRPLPAERGEGQKQRQTHTERLTRVTATRVVRETVATKTEEPTIHVSIGRVEVRAVTPPAAQPRTAPKPAMMTIDEYVARRKDRR